MQVRNLGCRRASGFIGTSAVCHVPLPDEFLHHRPKTADSRPIANKQGGRSAILDVNRCSFLAALGGAGATY